jgi:hypothetical protein
MRKRIMVSGLLHTLLTFGLASFFAAGSDVLAETTGLSPEEALETLENQRSEIDSEIFYWVPKAKYEMLLGLETNSEESVRRAIRAATLELTKRPHRPDIPCSFLKMAAEDLGEALMLREARYLLLASEEFDPLDYLAEQYLLVACLSARDFSRVQERLALRTERGDPFTDIMEKISLFASDGEKDLMVHEIEDLCEELRTIEDTTLFHDGLVGLVPEVPESVLANLTEEWVLGKLRDILSLLKVNSILFEDATAEMIYQDARTWFTDPKKQAKVCVRIADYLIENDWVSRARTPASTKEIEAWPDATLDNEAIFGTRNCRADESVRLSSILEKRKGPSLSVVKTHVRALFLSGRKKEMQQYLEKRKDYWKGTEWEEQATGLLALDLSDSP